MTMTKKQQTAESILRHGFALQRIYPQNTGGGPVSLCKALRRLELEASRHAERLCSDEQYCNQPDAEAKHERKEASILARVNALLGPGPAVFINTDPRGYALKIETEAAKDLDIHKDWGGYGIIAPDFSV